MAERAKRVPVEDFVKAYVEASKNDQTYSDLAKAIGSRQTTVYQRAYELRRSGVELPPLKSSRNAESMADRAKRALEEAMSSPSKKPKAKKEKVETVTDDEPLAEEPTATQEDQDELDAIFS